MITARFKDRMELKFSGCPTTPKTEAMLMWSLDFQRIPWLKWTWRPSLALCSIFLFSGLPNCFGEGEDVQPKEVQAAIEKGKRAVLRNLRFYQVPRDAGYAMIAVMALINSGVKPNDPQIAKVVRDLTQYTTYLTIDQYTGTYHAGVMLVMLSMVKDPKYKKLAARLTSSLKKFQYPNGGWGDYSRSQFALLGLKAAEDLGVEVPETVFKKAYLHIKYGQNPDGGWGYKFGRASTGSMTAAGIAGLYICGERLYRGTNVCGQGVSDKRLVRGLEWLANRFTVQTNPRGNGRHFYYLYGLERVGVMLAQRTIGGNDWYREGARYLVRTQRTTGHWGSTILDTEFALLFLGKGSQPVAIQKLRYGRDWNPDPYDVKLLVERASRDLSSGMTFQVVDKNAEARDLAGAPILYIQGRRAFSFDEEFRTKLRAFVNQGGFIFASACCGSKEFGASFRLEMSQIFPEATFDVLPDRHAVYSLIHRVSAPGAFMIEGMNTGCRTSILYAPHDICCAWSGCQGCRDPKCVKGEDSYKLGVNMIAYALDFQRLRDKLETIEIQTKPDNQPLKRGALVIGQLFHEGEWNPDPASIPNLAKTLQAEVGMKTQIAKKQVVLGRDALGDYPLLYITGHKAFEYSAHQVKILRSYLDKGGCILADPCCGKSEFDIAFKALLKQLYPNRRLLRIPEHHLIFQAPFKLDKVLYKPWAQRAFPNLGLSPHLESITHRDRITVIYSRLNLGCELQGHACTNCIGVQGKYAYRIAVNALLYALSH